jgi:hypothetical protein
MKVAVSGLTEYLKDLTKDVTESKYYSALLGKVHDELIWFTEENNSVTINRDMKWLIRRFVTERDYHESFAVWLPKRDLFVTWDEDTLVGRLRANLAAVMIDNDAHTEDSRTRDERVRMSEKRVEYLEAELSKAKAMSFSDRKKALRVEIRKCYVLAVGADDEELKVIEAKLRDFKSMENYINEIQRLAKKHGLE